MALWPNSLIVDKSRQLDSNSWTRISGLETRILGLDTRVLKLDTRAFGLETRSLELETRDLELETRVLGLDTRDSTINDTHIMETYYGPNDLKDRCGTFTFTFIYSELYTGFQTACIQVSYVQAYN